MTTARDGFARPHRVGIVGMGCPAYARLAQHYLDLPLMPALVGVADNGDDDRLPQAM